MNNLLEGYSLLEIININKTLKLVVWKKSDDKYITVHTADNVYILNRDRNDIDCNLNHMLSMKIYYSENLPNSDQEPRLRNKNIKTYIETVIEDNQICLKNSHENVDISVNTKFISKQMFVDKIIQSVKDQKMIFIRDGVNDLSFRIKINITDIISEQFDPNFKAGNYKYSYLYTELLAFYGIENHIGNHAKDNYFNYMAIFNEQMQLNKNVENTQIDQIEESNNSNNNANLNKIIEIDQIEESNNSKNNANLNKIIEIDQIEESNNSNNNANPNKIIEIDQLEESNIE